MGAVETFFERSSKLVAALVVALHSLTPIIAHAQCIAYDKPEELFAHADAVFLGTVVGVEATGAQGDHDTVQIVTLRVESVWKGPPMREVRVGTDRPVENDKRYVVFAVGKPLTTSILCRWAETEDRAPAKLKWLAAQLPGKPDFSGRWILESPNRPTESIARALSVRQTLVRTTVRGEPMTPFYKEISVDRDFPSGTNRSDTYGIGILGGTVVGKSPGSPSGERSRHAVTWEGNALVFEIRSESGPPGATLWKEHREVWVLDASDRLRVEFTTRDSSSDRSEALTLIYRLARQPPATATDRVNSNSVQTEPAASAEAHRSKSQLSNASLRIRSLAFDADKSAHYHPGAFQDAAGPRAGQSPPGLSS